MIELLTPLVSPDAVAVIVPDPADGLDRSDHEETPADGEWVKFDELVIAPKVAPPEFAKVMALVAAEQTLLFISSIVTRTLPREALAEALDG